MNKNESQYTEKLREMIAPLLKQAKDELARTHQISPILAFLNPSGSGKMAIVPMPPHVAEMLNSGEGKDWIFDGVRKMVGDIGIKGVVFLTDAWIGKASITGGALSRKRFEELTKNMGTEQMAAEGLITRVEAIMVSAQIPERTLTYSQAYTRCADGSIKFDEAMEMECPTEEFEGRLKMFGDLSAEKLHRHRDSELGKKQ
jgi:hypothetical protein